MSQLEEMNRQLREKGLTTSPVYSDNSRRINYPQNNGPLERQGL